MCNHDELRYKSIKIKDKRKIKIEYCIKCNQKFEDGKKMKKKGRRLKKVNTKPEDRFLSSGDEI